MPTQTGRPISHGMWLGSAMLVMMVMVLVLAACTGSDSAVQNDGTPLTAVPVDNQDQGEETTEEDADGTEQEQSQDDEQSDSNESGSLADSTEQAGDEGDEADETVPPPVSVVPTEFCEPTRVQGQAIRFQPGAEQALIRSPAQPGQSDLYSVEVTDGQIMTVSVGSDDDDVVAILLPPSGVFVPGVFTETTVTDTEAGNYWICVRSGDSSEQYELTVSVINDNTPVKISAEWCGTSVNDRGEIRFAIGSSSGQVDDAVIRGERDLYNLEAGAGQTFRGELSAFENNAEFQMMAPSGDIILVADSTFSIELPESGVYQLCVGSTRGNATYTIDLVIE